MAIVRIMRPPVGTEGYDAVGAVLDLEASPPEGLIVHTAGMVDGEFQVVDVWESLEHAEAFENDRLGPAIAEVMDGPPPGDPPQPTTYELHNLYRP